MDLAKSVTRLYDLSMGIVRRIGPWFALSALFCVLALLGAIAQSSFRTVRRMQSGWSDR